MLQLLHYNFLSRKTYSDPHYEKSRTTTIHLPENFFSSNTRRNPWPTAPLAPTIATFISLFIYNLLNTVSFVRYFLYFNNNNTRSCRKIKTFCTIIHIKKKKIYNKSILIFTISNIFSFLILFLYFCKEFKPV